MELTVIKSTLSSKGGYVNTLAGVKKSTVLGVSKTSKMRFLMKTDEAVEVGSVHAVNLAEYKQVEYSSTVVDTDGVERVINSTWLQDIAKA